MPRPRGGRTIGPSDEPAPPPESSSPGVRQRIEDLKARMEGTDPDDSLATRDEIIHEVIGIFDELMDIPEADRTPDEALVLGRMNTVFRPYDEDEIRHTETGENAKTNLIDVLTALIAPQGGRRKTRRRRRRSTRRRRTQK